MNENDTNKEMAEESVTALDKAEDLLKDLIFEISGRSLEPTAELEQAEPIVRQLGNLHQTLEHVQTARLATRVTQGKFGRDVA